MSLRAAGVVTALLLSSSAIAARSHADRVNLLEGSGTIALKIEAPLQELFEKGSEDDKVTVPGRVTHEAPGGNGSVTRDAQVSVRGHTSRRETECSFPKLKLKFSDGDELKIGTHCGEAAEGLTTKYGRLANEKSPAREGVAYDMLRAAGVPTLRTRTAIVTYVEAGRDPITRRALLLEDDGDAKKRVGGGPEITMESFGNVRTRKAGADAVRIAFGQAMIGNFDWCLKFSPDDIYRCNEQKPLWNVLAFEKGAGEAVLLAKDFDLAGVVVGHHTWFDTIFNPGFVESKSEVEIEVLSQVQRTRSLFPRAELDAARQSFREHKPDIYAALEKADVDATGRQLGQAYLDAFFAAITEDERYYRPVVAKQNVRVFVDEARAREACGAGDVIRPGTPVNELKRSGDMSQVVILDALWRWTGTERCKTVQTGPVWIESDAITRDFPSSR